MKLKFDPSLDYQRDAIDAIVGVFDGQPIAQTDFALHLATEFFQSELGVANYFALSDDAILANVHRIQDANGIEKVPALQGRAFSIEMETGTGKTYVYLRTIFELNKAYGFVKFIIVVPSVAIRETVLKSIEMTRAHLSTFYDNEPFDYFVYDSKRLGRVRQFATSNQIQIMIINIQSFQKDIADKSLADMTEDESKKLNVINRENDRMSGRRPIEFIQGTNPIVIIDEPQSVDNTPKSKRAIANLNPAATLRYSATHRNPYNLLYKLDPIKAYDMRLVKRIEVASVRSDDSFNEAYVKLLKTDNTKGIKAQVEIHKEGAKSPRATKIWVKLGDDLYIKSGRREIYRQGYIVQGIDCTPTVEHVKFTGGHMLEIEQEVGGIGDEIMQAQIYETVERHLQKERTLMGKGIKVLSLFFVDRVSNYRIYNADGTMGIGKIGQWFEDAYRELTARPAYRTFAFQDLSKIHNGYFSLDKQGRIKDTRGNTKTDEDTYNLIMKEKERLLDPQEPLRFIFSHSALREGWDNPNVFQICTLNETHSFEKKRQEIGRGLRLPVNQNGERIRDEAVNRLTVIANESYEEFASTLQSEFEEEFGIRFGVVEKIAFAKLVRAGREIGQETSARIWTELVANGYLNAQGKILDKFDPRASHFRLLIADEFEDLVPEIIDVMNQKVFKNRMVNAHERRELEFRKEVYLSEDFRALWDKIKHRTRYRLAFATDELIAKAIARIKKLNPIKPPEIATTIVEVGISATGISADRQLATHHRDIHPVAILPDILTFLQKETELTRHALVKILKLSGRLSEFGRNPQVFMMAVAKEIARAMRDLTLAGIQYKKIEGQYWEMNRIEKEAAEGIVRYLHNLYQVQSADKTLFNAVEYESEVERRFARDLDTHENVRLFLKLPSWFTIDTPIGPYNPDWAFVTERDEKLYFVRETKSTLDFEDRRLGENWKIACGQGHFRELGVDYDVVTALDQVGM